MPHILHATIVFAFAFLSLGYITQLEAIPTLPDIWGPLSVEPIDEGEDPSGYYWILAEVHFNESGQTFLLEEWSNRASKLFRLDIVDQATGWRQTILNNGDQERFHYRPFECYSFNRAKDIIKADFRDVFPDPLREDQLLLTGIGSLWKYVSNAMQYDFDEATELDTRKKTRWDALSYEEYDKFMMNSTAKYPFEVRFLFYPSQWRLDIPTGLAGIQLKRNVKSIDNHILIRIIRIDNSPDLIKPHLFQLPLGYGCYIKERPDKRHEYEPPKELIGNQSGPVVLDMEIVSHLPVDLNHDKWQTHSSFLRISRGTLTLGQRYSREYCMYQWQQHVPTLQSRRRIWDLGEPSSNQDNRERQRQHARYYDMDEIAGVCDGFEESQFDQVANVEFPMCIESSKPQNGSSQCKLQVAGIALDEKELQRLFVTRDGYKLVQYDDEFITKQIFLYERRDQRFALRNKQGSMVWLGPASIVRKYTKRFTQYNKSILTPPSPKDHEVQVTVNFLSSDLQRIIGKVSMTLLPVRRIDQAQFHRELSRVAVCFVNPISTSSNNQIATRGFDLFARKGANGREASSIDFLVSYLVGYGKDQGFAKSPDDNQGHLKDKKMREQVYEGFIESMIAVSDHRLNPLQFVDVEVQFVKDVARVTGTLVEMSALMDYRRLIGQTLSSSFRKWIQTEIKPDESQCARSCRHYQCSIFVYCPRSNMCKLLLIDNEHDAVDSRSLSITYEPDDGCNLFEQRPDNHVLSPMQFFHVFDRKLASRSGNTDEEMGKDLDIVVSLRPDDNEQDSTLVLRPDLPKIRTKPNTRLATDYEDLLSPASASGGFSQNGPQSTDTYVDLIGDR